MREVVRVICLIKHAQAGLFTDLAAGAGVMKCFYMRACTCVQLASPQTQL